MVYHIRHPSAGLSVMGRNRAANNNRLSIVIVAVLILWLTLFVVITTKFSNPLINNHQLAQQEISGKSVKAEIHRDVEVIYESEDQTGDGSTDVGVDNEDGQATETNESDDMSGEEEEQEEDFDDFVNDETDSDDSETQDDLGELTQSGEPDIDGPPTDVLDDAENFVFNESSGKLESDKQCEHYLGCARYSKLLSESDMPTCDFTTQEYLVGEWIDGFSLSTSSDPVFYEYQEICDSNRFKCHISSPNECTTKSQNIPRYQWIPSKCLLQNFNAAKFDKALKGKTVMFVGDSLMRQQFNSWRFLMRPVWKNQSEALRQTPEEFTTINGNLFIFEWAKYLVDEAKITRHKRLKIQPTSGGWAKRITEQPVDVMIFNVGHHWHKQDPKFQLYDAMADMVLDHVKQNFKGEKLIFRTSTPGHYDCALDEFKNQPIDFVPPLNETNDKYNWRKPIKAELIWQQKAATRSLNDIFYYLNVSHSIYRSDAHAEFNVRNGNRNVDCLHWCLPGIPDFWNHLLFNMILQP